MRIVQMSTCVKKIVMKPIFFGWGNQKGKFDGLLSPINKEVERQSS